MALKGQRRPRSVRLTAIVTSLKRSANNTQRETNSPLKKTKSKRTSVSSKRSSMFRPRRNVGRKNSCESESSSSTSEKTVVKASESDEKIDEASFLRNTLTLREILLSQDGLDAFLGFCHSQYAAENLLFWLHAERFRLLLDKEQAKRLDVDLAHTAVINHAVEVYNRFLKQDADDWVCLQTETVKSIKSYLQDTPDKIDVNLFVEAQQETLGTVENDIIPRFVQNAVLAKKFGISDSLRTDLRSLLTKPKSTS